MKKAMKKAMKKTPAYSTEVIIEGERRSMTEVERHRIIHLVAAQGYDHRTVARVLSGADRGNKLIYQRIRLALAALGVEVHSAAH